MQLLFITNLHLFICVRKGGGRGGGRRKWGTHLVFRWTVGISRHKFGEQYDVPTRTLRDNFLACVVTGLRSVNGCFTTSACVCTAALSVVRIYVFVRDWLISNLVDDFFSC